MKVCGDWESKIFQHRFDLVRGTHCQEVSGVVCQQHEPFVANQQVLSRTKEHGPVSIMILAEWVLSQILLLAQRWVRQKTPQTQKS